MLSDTQRSHVAGTVFTLRILIGSMAGGVLIFLILALAIAPGRPSPEPRISHGAVLLACVAAIACAIAPRLVRRGPLGSAVDSQPGTPDLPDRSVAGDRSVVKSLLALYQTRLLLSAAILEGAALLNIVAFLVEKQTLSIAVAAILSLLILVQFPSQGRVEDWVTRKLQDINVHDPM